MQDLNDMAWHIYTSIIYTHVHTHISIVIRKLRDGQHVAQPAQRAARELDVKQHATMLLLNQVEEQRKSLKHILPPWLHHE